MSSEDKDKIKIKLQRHKWPDELEKEKKRKRKIFTSIVAGVLVFAVGWTFGSVFYSPISQTQDANIARFERVYDTILKNWFFKNDMEKPEEELIDNAIKGMLERNGDPHTTYMTQEESEQFIDSIDMSFVGIGVQYQPADSLITRVFKNSPAEKAGILPGDIMVTVDDKVIAELPEDDDIKNHILGEKGTTVKIGVNRQGKSVEMDVVRDTVNALTWGEMLDKDTGYLEITSFGSSLGKATELYLDSFKKSGAKNLIIDLRDNGGGYLDAINSISALFFENNTTIYFEKFTDGTNTEYKVQNSRSDLYEFQDIVVLINENSASASEVFALALRDNLDATLVGVNSYGKGTVQRQTQDGVDSSYLKFTFAKWYSPNMENIHEVGIEPDIEVKLADVFYASYSEDELSDIKTYDIVAPEVSYVQKGLQFLGYHSGRTDSYYDVSTRDALHAFKKDTGLAVNDEINEEVLIKVYSSVVKEWSLNKKQHDTQLKKALEVIQLGS